jgi:hypothetical protein
MRGYKGLFRVMLLLAAGVVLGCGEQSEQTATETEPGLEGPQAGRIGAIHIAPANPSPMTSLEAEVLFRGREPERVSYQWLRNGTPIPGAIQPLLSSGHLHKGDFVTVEVQANYPKGRLDRSVSDVVVVGNSAPVLKRVTIEPSPATSGDTLQAAAYTMDRDNDQVSLTYEWTVDEEPIIGQYGPSLASHYFRRGSKVQVTATPFDGADRGNTKRSGVLVILNSAPIIVSVPPERVEQDVYRYVVKAEDPDGDPLRFSLGGQPPAGMKIDSETGVAEWQVVVPEKMVTYHFEVVVEDPEGAKSIQKITMSAAPPENEPEEG